MSDKKVLNINPELFSFSKTNSKTRKKKEKKDGGDKIKVKSAIANKDKSKEKTLKKRSILKMIREQQQNNYDKMFELKPQKKETNNFENEFEKATEYLDNLVKNQVNQVAPKKSNNVTLKNTTSLTQPLGVTPMIQPMVQSNIPVVENVNLDFPTNNDDNIMLKSTQTSIMPEPQYGCLKNGTLPTYRSFMNKTIKNTGGSNMDSSIIQQQEKSKENIRGISTIMQQKEMDKLLVPKKIKKPKKQKKTIRRTFKIGRSKIKPKVSVLISNKTIRNNISTKKQLLKQHSIPDIKKYLIKHGFIRVGSATPNDVLRKMYETATLVCGEIINHNPDNLLYNFVNTKE
tara:strand:+ start:2057 stop:3088 length:1032 start_codon:yes stop_codon:yes gene_type:complete